MKSRGRRRAPGDKMTRSDGRAVPTRRMRIYSDQLRWPGRHHAPEPRSSGCPRQTSAIPWQKASPRSRSVPVAAFRLSTTSVPTTRSNGSCTWLSWPFSRQSWSTSGATATRSRASARRDSTGLAQPLVTRDHRVLLERMNPPATARRKQSGPDLNHFEATQPKDSTSPVDARQHDAAKPGS